VHLAAGQLELQDQHVLGQPALVARERRRDAERKALLAQEGVAAVAGADAPDLALLREVHDEAAVGRQVAERVQSGHEVLGAAELVERGLPHACHQAHVRDHVGAVGDLDAHAAEGRPERAHHVRHDVERPALHRPVEEREHPLARFIGRHPVVGGPRALAGAAGDERQVLGARDVGRVAAVQVGPGSLLRVQPLQRSVRQHHVHEAGVLRIPAVAPDHAVRAQRPLHLSDPLLDRLHAVIIPRAT
jgi:hypothetical protein